MGHEKFLAEDILKLLSDSDKDIWTIITEIEILCRGTLGEDYEQPTEQ